MKHNKHHLCCGQRIRARIVDGQLVQQPHECERVDTAGTDWKAVKDEQRKETD